MAKNLVIVCAGDHSLHPLWDKNGYELWIIYYGNDPVKESSYKQTADRFFKHSGLKCELLRQICFEQCTLEEKIDFANYDYVWLPDDDLQFRDGDAPLKLFDVCKKISADVFQPAIENDNISWEPTRKVQGAFARRTNTVEIMALGFSGKVFKECFLTTLHACEFVESGWGIEAVWKNFGEALYARYLRTFVVDTVPVIHTRPIGSGGSIIHSKGVFEAQYFPQTKSQKMRALRTYTSIDEINADRIDYFYLDGRISRKPFYKKLFEKWNNSNSKRK